MTVPSSETVDYDGKVLIRNCLFVGASSSIMYLVSSGPGPFWGGGVKMINCTSLQNSTFFNIVTTGFSTGIPCQAFNNIIMSGPSTALGAVKSGTLIEDYNIIYSATPRVNVASGFNSRLSTHSMLIDIGQSWLHGFQPQPFGSPMFDSPVLGFGNNITGISTGDMLDRPKPSGPGFNSSISTGSNRFATSLPTVGAFEYGNIATKETGIVLSGANSIKLSGPGFHDFKVLVSGATNISIWGRYNANYATGLSNIVGSLPFSGYLPQAFLLQNNAIGVNAQTGTMTAAVDTWQQLTFNSFTPSSNGVVTLRLLSTTISGSGIAYFDALSIT
jgi:hypothetical protein